MTTNLQITYPPFDLQVPGGPRRWYMISIFLVIIFRYHFRTCCLPVASLSVCLSVLNFFLCSLILAPLSLLLASDEPKISEYFRTCFECFPEIWPVVLQWPFYPYERIETRTVWETVVTLFGPKLGVS